MKNIWLIALLSIVLGMVSCSKDDDEKNVYTVIFDADGGTPVPSAQNVEAGKTATAPATNPVKSGYVFLFWHLNGASTAYNFNVPVTSNITLQAKWEEEAKVEYWQVSWELNGGTWPASGDNHVTQVVKGGTLAEPTAPIKTGSTFDGWYKEATLNNKVAFPYDVSGVTNNFTLYTKWVTDDGGDDTPPTTMYIVGRDNYGACCWKVDLSTNKITQIALNAYGEANGIVISNGDVYISGFKTNTTSKSQACYWKNGVVTLLTESGKDFEGTAITASGNDIYVLGGERTSSGTKPCYWKNGTLTYLSASAQYAWGTDIFVSGNDVYISGGNGSEDPCYWKNGTKTSLTRQTYSQAETRSVFISGTDVYVAGRARYPGDWRACYWKNNSFVSLTDGTKMASINSIVASGGKVYAAGSEEITGTTYAACYWVNGNKTILEESILASIQDIALSGNNVYAIGCTRTSAGNGNSHYKASYWNNGVRIDLTDGKKESEAFAVALSWE